MKKLISAVLAVVLLISLCGCVGTNDVTPEELITGCWKIVSHTRNEEAEDNTVYEVNFFDDGSCRLYCEGVLVKRWYWSYKELEFLKGNQVYELRTLADDVLPDGKVSLKYNKRSGLLTLNIKVDNWEQHEFVFEKSDGQYDIMTGADFDSMYRVWLLNGEWKAKALVRKEGDYRFTKEQAENYVIKKHADTRLYCDDEFITTIDSFLLYAEDETVIKRQLDGIMRIEASEHKYDMDYDVFTKNLIVEVSDGNGPVEYMIFEKKETEMTDAEFAKMMLMNLYGDGVEFTKIYKSEEGKTIPADKIASTPKLIINDDNTYKFTISGAKYYEGNCNYSETRDADTGQGKFIKYGSGQHLLRIFTKENYIQLYIKYDDYYHILYFAKV